MWHLYFENSYRFIKFDVRDGTSALERLEIRELISAKHQLLLKIFPCDEAIHISTKDNINIKTNK